MATKHPNDDGQPLFYPDGETPFSEEERYTHFDFQSWKYKADRKNQYPDISEQLDMIYWDMKNGTNNWTTIIDKIKKENPKPDDII